MHVALVAFHRVRTPARRERDATACGGAAVRWSGDGLEPLLAESWSTQDDGLTWTIALRHGVSWHDGTPFTARDVVFSFDAYADPAVASRWSGRIATVKGYKEFQAGEAGSLSGVRAIDDYTVEVTLTAPSPNWMILSQPFIVIFPEHILGKVPRADLVNDPFWTNRVGTGPFKWDVYVPADRIEVVANDDYFLGRPAIDRIVYTNFADAASMLAALERGELDELPYEAAILPVSDLARYSALSNITVVPMNSGAPMFIRLNQNTPGLDEVRVRQAIMYAIDRAGINESLYGGAAPLRNSLFTQDWATPSDLNPYAFDPAMARALLAGTGFDTQRTYDFVYSYADQLTADVVTAMQAYLADVGIKISPRQATGAAVNQMYLDDTFEMGLVALGHGLDPSAAAEAVRCGALLAVHYCDPEVDRLFDQGLAQSDQGERQATYFELSRILNEDLPSVWLWQQLRPLAFSKRFVGPAEHWQEQPVILFNMPIYNEIEKWHLATE